MSARIPPSLLLAACLASALCRAAATDEALEWQRRPLRQPSPEGYLAIASLTRARPGPARAAISCTREGLELHALGAEHWTVLANGTEVARGALGGEPESLFVKRTAERILLGLNGRWVYGAKAEKSTETPEVLAGASPTLGIKSFRLVAREPVRFADDFPDPAPRIGVWQPVRGQWALSSVAYAEMSANPAELAAIFGPLEDEASRGRTREYAIGIGIQLADGYPPHIARVADDSPAEEAGLVEGDIVREIDKAVVRNAADAADRLQGEVGQTLELTIERAGKRQTLRLKRDIVVWGRTKQTVSILPSCREDVALIVTGNDFWTDYRFTAAVRTRGSGAFGLVFAYLGPKDYHVFRWLGADKAQNHCGRLQLERVRKGRRDILASRDGGFDPTDLYALSVEIHGDELGQLAASCAVDGLTVFSASDDALVPGQIGFWAEAPGAVFFDDVVVGEARTASARAARGTKSYIQAHDPTMRYWADPSYQWRYSDGQYWHKAPFPGDLTVSAAVPTGQTLRLTVAATEQSPDSGYSFELDEEKTRGILKRSGKPVLEKKTETRDLKRAFLAREGNRIHVALDAKPFLDFEDQEPLAGSSVGASGVILSDLRVESPNVLEDYFNGCPTQWHILRGHWEVMNRWMCDPRWSFFGGRNDDGLLAVWGKRRLDGDCHVDADVGVMMLDRTGGYRNMRDLAVTLCAERQDLASGYTVVVGAQHNSVTQLYRRGKLVASTSDYRALLPGRAFARGELYSQHRGWMHIRLAKEGRTVRFSLWDRPCLSYEDPEPLPGGHVAVWSVDNGLLLAKVRMAATRLGPPEPVFRTYPLFADRTLTNDCAEGKVRIAPQDAAYEITNMTSGGPFAAALRPRVFSALDRPKLSFEIRLSPEAKIDFYFSSHTTLFRIPLTGPDDPDLEAKAILKAPHVKADGQWHRVTVDFLGILKDRYPNDKLLMVWEPMLANFSNPGYLVAGFGGNAAGTTYSLRNISWTPSEEVAHLPQPAAN
jgi:hypothetical protein